MPQEMHVYIFIYVICIFKLYIHIPTICFFFFFPQESTELNCSLIAVGAGTATASSQAQHPPQRCLLSGTPLLWRVWQKLLLLKIVLFEMVYLQAPAKWVWNFLHLTHTVSHTTAYASLCRLSEAAWCLLISAKPCVVDYYFFFCQHLLSIVFTRCYLIVCLNILTIFPSGNATFCFLCAPHCSLG